MRASKKLMGAVLLTSSAALVLGAPAVHADSEANNNSGLLGGLNLLNGLQLNVPVTVGGVGVLGVGEAETEVESGNAAGSGSSSGNSGGGGSSSANNNRGLLGGLNVGNDLQANVPITVCGVGALLARGEGDCEVKSSNKKSGSGASSSANGNSGLLGGVNALNNAQLSVPVTVCGLAVLGDSECEAEIEAANVAAGGSGNGVAGSSANGNSGLLGGLNLLNNLQVSVPVTVCGLAVLGSAEAECTVESSNVIGDPDDDGDVDGRDRDRGSSVRGATLPHTGAAGLALIPFGLAMVAGGVALRRRVGAEA